MATTKRQDIVDLVITAIETIDGTGSFETTIGALVEDWGINFQESELPAVSVCDLSEEVVDDGRGDGYGEIFDLIKLDLRIRVQFSDTIRPALARLAIADILTAVRANSYWNNGSVNLALKTDFIGARFIVDEEKFLIGAAEVELNIFYRTESFNAFQ